MIKLAVPKEQHLNESRVSITPDCVPQLKKIGFEIYVESGAGSSASFPDSLYVKAGAKITKNPKDLYKNAKLVIKIQRPFKSTKKNEFQFFEPESNFLGLVYPSRFKQEFELLKKKKVNMRLLALRNKSCEEWRGGQPRRRQRSLTPQRYS